MNNGFQQPTLFPEVNILLAELVRRALSTLGDHLVGMYLDGSLTSGDFDADSDIDFVAVTDEAISDDRFTALQDMHAGIAAIDSIWAIQLEGSYLPATALRRYDPGCDRHPNLERGAGERLKWVVHGEAWNIHRYVLRERGIVLMGPPPQSLIDPVSPDDLRQAMRPLLNGWAARILTDPHIIKGRGYQSYVVLSLCRIFYTLQRGDVVSKRKAAGWVSETAGEKWTPLIERAWVGRHHPSDPADPQDINLTLDFIRHMLEHGLQGKPFPLS